jgi:hypothetical protein
MDPMRHLEIEIACLLLAVAAAVAIYWVGGDGSSDPSSPCEAPISDEIRRWVGAPRIGASPTRSGTWGSLRGGWGEPERVYLVHPSKK